jgi:hypothetical protein
MRLWKAWVEFKLKYIFFPLMDGNDIFFIISSLPWKFWPMKKKLATLIFGGVEFREG